VENPGESPGLSLVAGYPGNGNIDGTGAKARFNSFRGMIADGAGNLYIADTDNQTIRKVVIATGVVTTLAGDPGVAGASDGTGTAAHFHTPAGLASDGAGNLYIADVDNHAIRKLALATGVVTTVAGQLGVAGSVDGGGAAARFSHPTDVLIDGADLYVADGGNSTIRKMVLATHAVSTFAGSAGNFGSIDGAGAAAQLAQPGRLASDGNGNLYVTEAAKIRKIVIATATVSTLPISPGQTTTIDGSAVDSSFIGLASDGAGKLWISKFGHSVEQLDLATNQTTTDDGLSGNPIEGELSSAIACDQAGGVYVGYLSGNVLLARAAGGAVTTLAGRDGMGERAQFDWPGGAAEDGSGNLYVADSGSGTVRKIVVATGAVTTFLDNPANAGNGPGVPPATLSFNSPTGMGSDGQGNLYVANGVSLQKVVEATGAVTPLAAPKWELGFGTTFSIRGPIDVTADGAGSLYVIDSDPSILTAIRRVDLASGAVTTVAGSPDPNTDFVSETVSEGVDGVGAEVRFVAARGLTSDGDGNVYVADYTSVRKVVVATGTVTTLAGSPSETGTADGLGLAARFNGATSIASDHAGNLYVTDKDNYAVRKIVIATGKVTTVVGVLKHDGVVLGPLPAGLDQPLHVSMLSADRLVITTRNAVLMAHF
jgi:hypothetical protein